ncbi:hypothetical protein KSC_081840 [Ktedonobacter sp. SOSP1-52]|nr:hypothetical protein KSC_081840 [Ktedonobacter sp. SOSP1-52]
MGADETKLRRSLEDETVWGPLRDKLYSLLMLKWKEVANTRDYLKREWSGLPGRTFEKWLPLATIAGLVSQEVFNDIRQLAEESLEEQQEDAENVYDALLFKFAARVVQSGDQFLSRGELYDMFVSPSGTSFGGNDAEERAQWAEDTDAAITTTKLKRWIRSDRMLISELKRLHLIPQNAKHTRSGDRYELNQAEIMRIVGAYIGTNFLK